MLPLEMKFRPCIDIHAGVVKQIVGSTLTAESDEKPVENFVASNPAEYFSRQFLMFFADCYCFLGFCINCMFTLGDMRTII